MTNRVVVGNLRVAEPLYDFITNEALPGTGIDTQTFWSGVDKVVADPTPWLARKTIKVHGFVVPGSIKQEVVDQQTHRSFRLYDKADKEIWVRHTGPIPDTFKDKKSHSSLHTNMGNREQDAYS